MQSPSRPLLFSGLCLSIVLGAVVVAHQITTQNPSLPFGLSRNADGTQWAVHDFANLFNYSQGVVQGEIHRPYVVEEMIRRKIAWTGDPQPFAMPHLYSPTAWLLLSPLTHFSAPVAFALWNLAALALLLTLVYRDHERHPVFWSKDIIAALMITLVSATYLRGLELGQTAPLALVVFFWVYRQDWTQPARAKIFWIGTLFLFSLTAKPPLALTLGCFFVWTRQWKIVTSALLLVAWECLFVTWWLGSSWITDYLHLLGNFDTEHAPAALIMVDNQVSMSNLRNGLRALLHVPDSVAVLVSHVVWLGSLALFTWRHLRVKPRFHASYQLSLGLLLYLLFCPHLTFTEDILLLIPVLGLLLIHPTSWNRVGSLVVLATALNLGLCKAFYPTLTGTMIVLLLKLLLLGWLLRLPRPAINAP